MKRISKLFLIVICLLLMTGCEEETTIESGTKVSSKTEVDNASGTIICARSGSGINNSSAELSYEVNYAKGYLTKVHSIEKVKSEDQETLNKYEDAYKNIFKNYKDLKHYENNIIRDDSSVTSDTTIDYSKVDMNKLKQIEASDESLIKNGKIALKDWLTFAEKFGTNCVEK